MPVAKGIHVGKAQVPMLQVTKFHDSDLQSQEEGLCDEWVDYLHVVPLQNLLMH